MSESLKTVLSEWRPLNGETGERPSAQSDDPSEVENAAQAALIRKMANALAVVRDALTAAGEAGLTGRSDTAEAKPLLDRLRKDGNSWAQPLFNEAADRIEELDCQLAEARAALTRLHDDKGMYPSDANHELTAWETKYGFSVVSREHHAQCIKELNDQHAATENNIQARAEDAERQLAEARAQYEADKQRGHKYRDKLVSQLAELRRALGSAVVGLQNVFPRDTLTDAALADVWAALEGTRDLSHGLVYPRSPTTGNGDEP